MQPAFRRSTLLARYGRARANGGGSYQRALDSSLSTTPICPTLFGIPGRPRRARAVARGLGDAVFYGIQPPFNGYVEAWRSAIESQAGDLPVDFLLAWISVESNGNPCSWTSLSEAGIFQLMAGDNVTVAGTTLALQHPVPPCVSGRETGATFDSLSSDQQDEQVRAGIQYVNYCRQRAHALLDQFGYSWDESTGDFWSLVKMVHVAPGVIPKMLQAGIDGNGAPPSSWDELTPYVSGVPASWLQNARSVGLFGTGGGSLLNQTNLLVLGALGLGLWYLWRATR